jgi:hypothetical protein
MNEKCCKTQGQQHGLLMLLQSYILLIYFAANVRRLNILRTIVNISYVMATVAGGHKGVKRKISSECRDFNSDWTERYFFTLSRCKTKPLCLICNESIAAMKEYNVRRHYEAKHGEAYTQLTGKARSDKLADLQRQLNAQQNIFRKANNESVCAVKASYVVAELIAKAKKPFSEGEFVKECMLKVADVLCPDKKQLFSNISLSRNTIADRITEMAQDVSGQLSVKARKFIAYSLAADESTDLSDTSQLSVFIRGVECDLTVVEEFVSLLPMSGTTKGVDVFSKVETLINDMQLPWENLRGLTTDGAPAMTSENTGLVGLVKKRLSQMGCSGSFISSHCIIHQEALCARVVSMPHVMNIVVKTVNYIRAHALNHRQFKTFLDDLNAEHGDVLYYTEVRWLSRGTVLKRFFDLRTEIAMFLVHKDNGVSELEDPNWLADLAFLVDITSELNALNVKLQGRDQLVTEMYDHVRSFERKLLLWEKQLQDKNFVHFPTCTTIAREYGVQLKANNDLYVSKLGELRQEFGRRFDGFRTCEAQFSYFL